MVSFAVFPLLIALGVASILVYALFPTAAGSMLLPVSMTLFLVG